MKKWIIGITGASGSVYAHRLIEAFLTLDHDVSLLATDNAREVCRLELGRSLEELCEGYRSLSPRLHLYSNTDLLAPVSSGSHHADGMVIVPCSMGTLGKIAGGISDSLMTRAADVSIKERRPLLLAVRESPLSAIHLENMLKLARLGVIIMPPVIPFYHKPASLEESTDLLIGRILDTLGVENPYHRSWRGSDEE